MLIDPREWNQKILQHPDGSFLQSYEWGEFQAGFGRPVRRTFLASRVAMQSVRMPLPLGVTYELVSRGPAADDVSAAQLALELHELGRSAGALFVRCEPVWDVRRTQELALAGFRRTAPMQPETTLVLDLTISEAELLVGMREDTRYNIRLAERRGVRVREAGLEQYPAFWGLISETADFRGFRTHDSRYQKLMAERFLAAELGSAPFMKPVARLFLAEVAGELAAAAMVLFFGRTAAHLYGGTSRKHRKTMAAHLLRWTAIQRAKEVGCDKYDMWGIAPRSGAMPSPHGQARSALRGAIVSPHGQARTGIASRRDAIDSPHDQAQRASSDAMYPWQKRQIKQWAGFTQFKQGFGGRVVEYVGTWDLPLRSTWYRLYQLARYARRQAALF